MEFKGLFRKPKNTLEIWGGETAEDTAAFLGESYLKCPKCGRPLREEELEEASFVCGFCGYHFRMAVRERISMLTDPGSFRELFAEVRPENPIDFPGYEEKLSRAAASSGETEGVLCGEARIGGVETCIFVMNPDFMMGSMGTAVGERITRLFEYAEERSLPVVGYTVSGGARMQEGILSLMQMAKVSGAVKRHSQAGLLYIAVLTDPTTGGVTASFATEGDILLAEPGALIGFAGPRVIEQTILQKLPDGFQRAEFLLEKGFLDAIVPRGQQKAYLTILLELHSGRELI